MATTLLLGLSIALQNLARDELAGNAAEHIEQIATATEEMLKDPVMFDAIYLRAVNPGFTTAGVYEIPFTFFKFFYHNNAKWALPLSLRRPLPRIL